MTVPLADKISISVITATSQMAVIRKTASPRAASRNLAKVKAKQADSADRRPSRRALSSSSKGSVKDKPVHMVGKNRRVIPERKDRDWVVSRSLGQKLLCAL